MAKAIFTQEDDALLEALEVDVELKKVAKRTPKEERVIAGFEEIQRFVDSKNKLPSASCGNDIFERIYSTRLEQIRKQPDLCTLLAELDHQNPLEQVDQDAVVEDNLSDDEMLADLGIKLEEDNNISNLRNVRSNIQKAAAEDVATREKCEDFDKFKPLFEAMQNDLDIGARETLEFRKDAGFTKTDIKQGQFFILGGQTAYVADVGEHIKAPNGDSDARLRVIYSNKTESNILLRSVMRALYKDETSRLISDPLAGPLFSGGVEDDDLASGTVYVLKSKSEHPYISANREILHKIGVTGGSVEKRIANARLDATFLMADVEVVATYQLFNINRTKLENLIHRFFESAKLDIEIPDRFGNLIAPREWFQIPVFLIDEAIQKFQDGSIGNYRYDPATMSILKIDC